MKSEKGLSAVCWFCEIEFVKDVECSMCGFYVCPHCNGCGCKLTINERRVARICVATFLGLEYWNYWKNLE